MKKNLIYLGALIGLPLIVCIGLSTCGLLYVNQYPGGEWESYPQPPVRAVEILTIAEQSGLVVRSIDNKVYACNERDGCHEIAAEEVVSPSDLCGFTREAEPPTPPGTVNDSADFRFCGADISIYETYVIMEDGSIWQWSYSKGWGEGVLIYYVVMAGTIGTFIIVAIIVGWLALDDLRNYLYQESIRRR